MKDKQRQEHPVQESVYDLAEFIALAHCKDQWLYRIRSRNLILGVFRKDQNGFVGIREKFGYEYLFVEFHWDTGEPHGTVKPLEPLERCPIANLDEDVRNEDGALGANKELFDWLRRKEVQHIGKRKRSLKKTRDSFIVVFKGK